MFERVFAKIQVFQKRRFYGRLGCRRYGQQGDLPGSGGRYRGNPGPHHFFKSSVGEVTEPATGQKLARHYGTASDDGESRRGFSLCPFLRSGLSTSASVRRSVGSNPTRPTSLSEAPHKPHTTPTPWRSAALLDPLPP